MNLIGIDPGVTGAIAVLTPEGDLLSVYDMPVFEVVRKVGGKNKTTRHVDAYGLGRVLSPVDCHLVMMEQIGPMPRDGAMQAFRFGKAAGVAEGVVGGLQLRFDTVTPQRWKKHFRLTADKEQARMMACRRWPDKADYFKRKLDAGRAEAALIALFAVESTQPHQTTR